MIKRDPNPATDPDPMTYTGPQSSRLPDGRLHLNHGPIDLIIEAFGACSETEAAYSQAEQSFQTILNELVSELALLRTPVGTEYPRLTGSVARRMAAAVWPLQESFITPMAAVAGAVADHVLLALVQNRDLQRAYVNNGGDIALYLSPGERFEVGLVSRVDQPELNGSCTISAELPVRGIATSGWRGRSFSLGIADAVTVLAENAAQADAAATIIANAVKIEHPAIQCQPANTLDLDSDLGQRAVIIAVGELEPEAAQTALDKGLNKARNLHAAGLIHGAVLCLQQQYRVLSVPHYLPTTRPLQTAPPTR